MLELYGHPFALYTWKPLIALYERGTPFTFVMLDGEDPDSWRPRLAELSPAGSSPCWWTTGACSWRATSWSSGSTRTAIPALRA